MKKTQQNQIIFVDLTKKLKMEIISSVFLENLCLLTILFILYRNINLVTNWSLFIV